MADRLEQLRDLRDIQGRDGTWNFDPYMQGMFNGLELAVATMEDREPQYRSAPDKWLMVSQAERDVIAERRRQIKVEGWTPEHDDEHRGGSMAYAAAAYAVSSTEGNGSLSAASKIFLRTGWAKSWWKPRTPREDLIRAAALLLAEIERLDRAAGKAGVGGRDA